MEQGGREKKGGGKDGGMGSRTAWYLEQFSSMRLPGKEGGGGGRKKEGIAVKAIRANFGPIYYPLSSFQMSLEVGGGGREREKKVAGEESRSPWSDAAWRGGGKKEKREK